MKKRIFSAGLALAMLLGLSPVQALAVDGAENEEFAPLQEVGDVIAEEVVFPVEGFDYSNDELLEGYILKSLYGNDAISMYGEAAGKALKGNDKTIYEALKPKIKEVADGGVLVQHLKLILLLMKPLLRIRRNPETRVLLIRFPVFIQILF